MGSALSATSILPLARFKATASEVVNGMKRDGRPVVITQNGEAAALLVPPMKPFRVRWTERARLDLIEIGDYTAVRNPVAAASFTDGLIRCAEVHALTVFEGHKQLDVGAQSSE